MIVTLIDKSNKMIKSLAPLSILVGGIILMMYFHTIGYFAYDISIGDGLYLISIAATFGMLYIIFIGVMTCAGLTVTNRLIWKPLNNLLNFIEGKFGVKNILNDALDFKVKTEPVMWLLGTIGTIWILLMSVDQISKFDLKGIISLLSTTLFCALGWNGLNDIFSSERQKSISLMTLFILPLLLSGANTSLMNGTMRLLNIRQEHITIHLKKPYIAYAKEYGFNGSHSDFGDEYLKYTNFNAVFTGPGKSTVISPQNDKHTTLVIPNESLVIIKNKKTQSK
ncbi:hypothetical protein [Phytobacter sp. V91]|uniref:hypothetical protein n=1 Tax=Phytobacter sp. V91 TaxID=3369425 RepID=UPI003F5E379F